MIFYFIVYCEQRRNYVISSKISKYFTKFKINKRLTLNKKVKWIRFLKNDRHKSV